MRIKSLSFIFVALAIAMAISSCSNRKSYAQLLNDENMSVNSYLVNFRVIGYEERDSTFNFEYGENAPFYQLDEDGNAYMQVINPGTNSNRAKVDQLIYFRFTRYNLYNAHGATLPEGSGNDVDVASGNASFRYSNMSSYTSYQWGSGIQLPLVYLPIDCEVNIIIKSQLGLYSEIANVVPYLYNVRYFKSQI